MVRTRITFADAAAFQAAFDAIEAGTGTLADAQEVEAVMAGFDHLRAIGNRAGQIIDARINQIAAVPADKRDAVVALLDGDDAREPALIFDRDMSVIGTGEDIAGERQRRADEAEAAKAAATAAAEAPTEAQDDGA